MRIAYVVGPYRAETSNEISYNIENARAVAIEFWRRGFVVICPHLNSAHMDGIVHEQAFTDGYLEIMTRLIRGSQGSLVVVLPRWALSEGSIAEIALAQELSLEITYLRGKELDEIKESYGEITNE